MSPRLRLIVLSFLMLFVELVLIRWLGSNIVFLSYFTNFVLLGSFLGIGIGFLRANRDVDLSRYAPVALALLVGLVWFFLTRGRPYPDAKPEYFRSPGDTGLPIWIVLPLIFTAVAAVMALISEGVARVFKTFEPLEAYRLDILGSLLGVVCFSLMSFMSAPPVAWGVVVGGLFLSVSLRDLKWYQAAAIVGLLLVLSMQSFGGQIWSPYYRIQIFEEAPSVQRAYVNGRPHQWLTTNAIMEQSFQHFLIPFLSRADREPIQDLLVIGSGTGNDVQIALSLDAEHVDAVEIDPGIQGVAERLNPEAPFNDPRVSSFITDGRAFLEGTDRKYDMIMFAIPDSLTLIAGNANLRLEGYLLTEEAMTAARDHLKPGGIFMLSEYFREGFAAERAAGTMHEVFGPPPCKISVGGDWHQVIFLSSTDPSAIACAEADVWQASETTPPPVTDDRPFAYIEGRTIPVFYLVSLAGLLLVSLIAVRLASGPIRQMRPYLDLFFMGAAFLLLETKNVVQFALLFGSTWFVNALVFAGILLTVLAAIEVAQRYELKSTRSAYLWLFGSLAVAWLVPSSWLLALPYVVRVVVAIAIAFAPVFFANLVFARRFREVGASTIAFGANLLGAMIGGMLEYGSLLIGYRSLTIVAAALYGAAWFFGTKTASPGVDKVLDPAGDVG